MILPGFRSKWITGNEGEAEKDYSYFLVGDGEVRTANRKDLKGNKDSGVEGTTETHCDLCSAECWGESYHLQEGCAEALGVKAAAKGMKTKLKLRNHFVVGLQTILQAYRMSCFLISSDDDQESSRRRPMNLMGNLFAPVSVLSCALPWHVFCDLPRRHASNAFVVPVILSGGGSFV